MSKIDPEIYASLYKHIQKWIEGNTWKDNWNVGFVSDDIARLMTDGAAVALNTCLNLDEYHKREGNLV